MLKPWAAVGNKDVVVRRCNEILNRNKNGRFITTGTNMDKSHLHHVERKQPETKEHTL